MTASDTSSADGFGRSGVLNGELPAAGAKAGDDAELNSGSSHVFRVGDGCHGDCLSGFSAVDRWSLNFVIGAQYIGLGPDAPCPRRVLGTGEVSAG
ncbi:MAG: hypothetical protein JSU86_13370 [Phycisphaerales bacterium]|nr:MAG: hypothetical protein JSU86_13370 [Phycisphaerales bacterium]